MTPLQERKAAIAQRMYDGVKFNDDRTIAMSRLELANHIATMMGQIRSVKWDLAVTDYMLLVMDSTNDLEWAYGQGSVWFAYAVM